MASLCRDHGTSTLALRAAAPLRMRVSMSAMGSVIMSGSPAGLHEARDLSLAREVPQAEPAHAKAAEERTRPSAQRATVVGPDPELRGPGSFHHEARLRHSELSYGFSGPEGHPEAAQQGLALGIGPGRGADHDRESLDLVDLVEVDLGEDHLLAQAERVVSAPIERSIGHPLEVAHPREGDRDQPVEELVHAHAPE